MSSQRLTLPIFALLFAVFCGELQAGVILLVPDDMQAGPQNTTSLTAAMVAPDENGQEGDSAPFVDTDPSKLEGYPDDPGTRVVSVACGALEVKWVSDRIVTFAASGERSILPPLIPSCLLKVPIFG